MTRLVGIVIELGIEGRFYVLCLSFFLPDTRDRSEV